MSPTPPSGSSWDDLAGWWAGGFTDDADPEYAEQILPIAAQQLARAAGGRVLDLGCGEGQIARLLTDEHGCDVVGVDASAAQLAEAHRRAGGPVYARATGERLGLRSSSVDAVLACLVFEHVADPDPVLDEVVRVLRPGGCFVWMLNHPLVQTPDSGWIDDHTVDPPEQYWQLGPYLEEAETVEQVDNGVFITFFHRPLSRHVNAAIARGLILEEMLEPAPPPGFLALAPGYADSATVPRLMILRFRRG